MFFVCGEPVERIDPSEFCTASCLDVKKNITWPQLIRREILHLGFGRIRAPV